MADAVKTIANLVLSDSASHAKDTVLLGHGSGGTLSAELIREVFLPAFQNPVLERLDDQAIVTVNGHALPFTTDSFVVKPLFFPGGDIGSLAVHGTVNDLAMGGAKPLFLSAAFILEEGLSMDVLRRVVASMREAAAAAGVRSSPATPRSWRREAATAVHQHDRYRRGSGGRESLGEPRTPGRQRAAERHHRRSRNRDPRAARRAGVRVAALKATAPRCTRWSPRCLPASHEIRCMRDPTRGGVSSALNEIAAASKVGIELVEREIPVREEVRGACEMLGLDPLYVANEGKLIAIVAARSRRTICWRRCGDIPWARNARMIGKVCEAHPGLVTMRTDLGTSRIVDMLAGDQLPRIC